MTKKKFAESLVELLMDEMEDVQIETFEEVGSLTRDEGFFVESDLGSFRITVSEW